MKIEILAHDNKLRSEIWRIRDNFPVKNYLLDHGIPRYLIDLLEITKSLTRKTLSGPVLEAEDTHQSGKPYILTPEAVLEHHPSLRVAVQNQVVDEGQVVAGMRNIRPSGDFVGLFDSSFILPFKLEDPGSNFNISAKDRLLIVDEHIYTDRSIPVEAEDSIKGSPHFWRSYGKYLNFSRPESYAITDFAIFRELCERRRLTLIPIGFARESVPFVVNDPLLGVNGMIANLSGAYDIQVASLLEIDRRKNLATLVPLRRIYKKWSSESWNYIQRHSDILVPR